MCTYSVSAFKMQPNGKVEKCERHKVEKCRENPKLGINGYYFTQVLVHYPFHYLLYVSKCSLFSLSHSNGKI